MKIVPFYKKTRIQSIQSLQYFFFLQELVVYVRANYGRTKNPLILNFLKVLNWYYSWEYKQIYPYMQGLTDQVFWQSSKFYRETMQKFVGGELNALEFAEEFSDRLLADREKANNLIDNYREQVDIELTPNIFEFSNIILAFDLLLEVYQNEVEELEEGELSEDDLSFKPDGILEGVKQGLEKINKYFTD